MNIGIDVDGVLVDMENYQLKYGAAYFKENYNMPIVNAEGYDIQDIFECTHEQREKFWTKWIWRYCLKEPMTKDAAKTVAELRKAGHKIYVITGRAHTTEKGITGKLFRLMLKYWLWKNKFKYDEIIFCSEKESSHDKYDICLSRKIDIMLDDKPENLTELKDMLKIVCYNAIWNKNLAEFDSVRISSFNEFKLLVEDYSHQS